MTDLRAITILSGGQTGADRAALDFAIAHGIPYGGWCPRGRLAEDGPIDARYELQETPSRRYAQRTEWNVRDSDGTLVCTIAKRASGGTGLTLACTRRFEKPALHLSRNVLTTQHGVEWLSAGVTALLAFIDVHRVRTLNVAGPRGSQEPEIAAFVEQLLTQALAS